jgi:thioredoxin reductase (NADPH)
MSENEMYDVVIVGGGPGGLSAGIYAIRAALKTVLIEKGITGGQINLTESVENYPGYENITGFELSQKFLEHAKSYDLEIIQEEVALVEPGLKFHSVRLANGKILNSHAVILATGGSPRKLGVAGELEYYGKGVSYCATCDGFFFRGKDVVVVGGGDTALEEALYLAKITRRVSLIHRRDAFRGSRILQQRVDAEEKINIIWNTVVTEIKANEEGVTAVGLKNTQTGAAQELGTDGVFIFIGFLPNNNLVPAGVTLNYNGYVITDERCETSLPGIYAIGDLRQKFARQIVTAAADGCTAALAAALKVEMKKAAGNGIFYNL